MPKRYLSPVRGLLRTRGLIAASLAFGIVLSASPRPALAWGRMAHRASASLAEARLRPAALAEVRGLLNPGETLADASTWADEVRRDRPKTGPWHYVNVPITEARYDARFCPAKGCVVAKVGDFRRVLADRSAFRDQRAEALRFLTHFLQDMHQPVHVGDRADRGGNDLQVRFFQDGSNLHRVWDSGLLGRAFSDEPALLRDLEAQATPERSAEWSRGSVEDWADESLQAAKDAYRNPETGMPLKKGARLREAYFTAGLPVARARVAQSAVRLAAVLNTVLDPEP